jgi:lipopolysaccharide export system permease protein
MTIMLIRIVGQAAKGQADPSELILLIGLNGIGNAAPILTLSLFISVIYTFSRMYLDSEMVIWFTSGFSLSKFLAPLVRFSWAIILLICLLTTWAWPWSNIQTQNLKDRFNNRTDIERVSPGQFQESKSNQTVFFVEKYQHSDGTAKSVFISKTEGDIETITTAQSGTTEFLKSDKFLSLKNGQQTIINHRTGDFRVTEFQNFKFWLEPPGQNNATEMQSQMLSTSELFYSQDSINRGELFWRIGLCLAAINLTLLAVQLASVNPRVGRSYSLAMGILCFVGYYNMVNVGQNWIASGRTSLPAFMVMLHGGAFVFASCWLLIRHFNLSWRSLMPSPSTGARGALA